MNGWRFLIKYAWRNLFRHPMRTLVMALGLAFGTGYIIFALNFSESGSREVVADFLSQYFGHHQVVHPRYYPDADKKRFDQAWTISDELTRAIPMESHVRRVTLPVFLSGPLKTLGTLLSGVEVEQETRLSKVARGIAHGRFLDPNGSREIVIGERMARKIGAKVGDEVAVIGSGLDGSVANDMFRVVGLLSFGGGDMEDLLAFTTLEESRVFASVPDGHYHQLVGFDMNAASPPPPPGTQVMPWPRIVPEISAAVEFIDRFTWIVSAILVMVISLGLANTLMITFLEREKEFNALNVIGARSSWVAVALVWEVFFLGVLGIVIGIAVGWAVTYWFNVNPINIMVFTGGKPIMMGGIAIIPRVRLWMNYAHIAQAVILVSGFLAVGMAWPLWKVIKRSQRAH
jgi:putative ABC transport system permease protein